MSTINSSSSSTTSTYNSGSTMRITGMASGMDIDGLVKSMLAPDQNKIDEAKKAQQTYTWKQEAYQSIIKDVKDLQSSFFDITSSSGSMTSASYYLAMSAASADTTVVNATVTADAVTGTYGIDVTNTAKNAKLTGTKSINGQINVGKDSDVATWSSSWKGKTLKFALNDDPANPVKITIPSDATINSASDLVKVINTQISSSSGLNGNVSATLVTDSSSNNNYIKFNASPNSEVATLNVKDISSSIELNNGWNGKNIKLSDGTTGDDLTLSIDSTFSGSIDDLVSTLNDKLSATTNYKDLTVSNDNGKLKFTNASKTKAITIAPATGNSIPDLGSGLSIASNNGTAETTTFGTPDFSGWVGKNITFDVNGASKTVNLSGPISDANGLASALQSAIGNSDIQVTAIGNSIKFSTTNSATVSLTSTDVVDLNSQSAVSSSANIKLSSLVTDKSLNTKLNLALKYDGQDIAVSLDNSKGNKTIGDLEQAINTATGGKVTATVDDISGQLVLKTSDTGAVASLQIESSFTDSNSNVITTDTNLLSALGLSTSTLAQGSDANVKITQPDGTATTLTETSNSFTVNGITYNLIGAQKSTTITVTSDSQDVYDKISKFLDKYNTVIDEIQTKLQEKKDYDYPPLTDAQKASMTETQIKNWEDKAKKGILRNDDNLQNLLTDLRKAFTTPLTDSSGNRIVSLNFGKTGTGAIGIDTSDSYSDGDKITIQDAQKLKDAISKNSSQLVKLFTNVSSTDSFDDSGIFKRIDKILKNNVGVVGTSFNSSTLTKYANVQDDYSVSGGMGTGTIPDQIYTQQLLVKKYTAKYTSDQTKYYNQFAKLESLMTQLSSQQSSLSAMLGS